MEIRWGDLAVIVVYFLGITMAGLWFARRNKSTEDYFLGGRNFPGWAIGLSMVGTSISSVSFLGYPADAYKTTFLRLLPAMTLPLGVLIASIVFLPFFRRGKITSAYEYLEGRFGPGARVYGALIFITQQLVRIGMILWLLSVLIYTLTGLSVEMSIIIAGVFVSFYTIVGGFEAVIWTDVVQTIVLFAGGVFALVFICMNLDGGIMEIFKVGMEHNKFSLAEGLVNPDTGVMTVKENKWNLTLYEKTAMMLLIYGLFNWLMEYSSNQNIIQRYCASKSAKEARKAMWVCVAASIPIWTFFMFLGTALYVYYQANPDPHAVSMYLGHGWTGEAVKAEGILPHFSLRVLPMGIAGLVMAAAMAAAMSSLDSSLNAISTVFVVDIYRRHLVKEKDDAHYLKVAKIVAIICAFIMLGVAMIWAKYDGETLQDTNTIIASITMGGLFGLFFLGFITKWGDDRAVFGGVIATVSFSLLMVCKQMGFLGLSDDSFPAIDQYYTGIVGNVIMFLVGFFLGGLFPRKKGRDLTNLTVWTQDKIPLD